jgi:septal ring factor EnvC (AmiA/AmiB activator)
MSVDLRRFEYALEPVRRQRAWRLDALRALLGAVQRDIEAERARLDELLGRHSARSRTAARACTRQLDPGAYAPLLRWLAQLRGCIHASERALAELRARHAEVTAQCRAQQRKVDAVEKHREDCIAEFVQREGARLFNETDRDWLARLHWNREQATRRGGIPCPEATP